MKSASGCQRKSEALKVPGSARSALASTVLSSNGARHPQDAIRADLALMMPGANLDAGVRDLVGIALEHGECDWQSFLVKRADINA